MSDNNNEDNVDNDQRRHIVATIKNRGRKLKDYVDALVEELDSDATLAGRKVHNYQSTSCNWKKSCQTARKELAEAQTENTSLKTQIVTLTDERNQAMEEGSATKYELEGLKNDLKLVEAENTTLKSDIITLTSEHNTAIEERNTTTHELEEIKNNYKQSKADVASMNSKIITMTSERDKAIELGKESNYKLDGVQKELQLAKDKIKELKHALQRTLDNDERYRVLMQKNMMDHKQDNFDATKGLLGSDQAKSLVSSDDDEGSEPSPKRAKTNGGWE